MEKTEPEAKFEEYREHLRQEAVRLASYVRLYRRLHERRADRLAEMNMAPAFFQVVIDALFSAIVLWVDKLFSERSERGLANFLMFCEYNLSIFGIKELQRRRNYPDGHWMLDREPITFQTIQDQRDRINNLKSLRSFKLRRDKFHAHFDKEYFFDGARLSKDAPLKWSDLEELIEVMKDIVNTYSAAYDGNLHELEPMNVTDVDYLLDRLHRSKAR
jgi:hypothetical protein